MTGDPFSAVPSKWATADDYSPIALRRTWAALNHPDVVERLATYYKVAGDFAGATFLELDPVNPYAVNGADLAALTLLKVEASPAAVRRLLSPSARLGPLLAQDKLPLDADLQFAGAETLQAMEDLYLAIKPLLSQADVKNPNAWVTASKLCARKRPDLFPVRDNVVCKYLGLIDPQGNYEVDWQVFRHVIQDNDIRRRLDQVVDEASQRPGVDVGHLNRRLRHLDVVLWMHARPKGTSAAASGDVAIPLG
jgi:hypothetical protein